MPEHTGKKYFLKLFLFCSQWREEWPKSVLGYLCLKRERKKVPKGNKLVGGGGGQGINGQATSCEVLFLKLPLWNNVIYIHIVSN